MKLARRQFLFLTTAASAAFPIFSLAAGADSYPAALVKFIVPLSAGSGADILARLLATKMSDGCIIRSWSKIGQERERRSVRTQ
jgi:tripartite-type tricarboxylate transporter receptor subunit TctC